MVLKEIIINGFKSFPEKTIVKINAELTAIVGPNGSGKSNISDAFKWVMGEQSPKLLRGSKMEDVIFAGTLNRKPLGYAEVDLVFNNEKGTIPIAYTEVSVKRRLYRNGDSAYLLNNKEVRLKEIKELFMDTGIGIEGYSIIGQGRVEDIISSKSELRRRVIEEAVGIVKYKTRKDESLKKLAKTEENLIRIHDIISEIEHRIEPLKKQKESAETFLEIKDKLKTSELNLFSREYEKHKELLESLENQQKQKSDLIHQQKINTTAKKNELDQLLITLQSYEVQIDEITQKINDTHEQQLELEKKINLENDRRILYEEEKAKLLLNQDKNQKEHMRWSEKQDNLSKQIKQKQDELKVLIHQLNQLQSELDNESHQYSHDGEDIEKVKSQVFHHYQEQSEKRNRLNNVTVLIQSIEERIESLTQEKNHLNSKQNKNHEKTLSINEQIQTLTEKLNQEEQVLSQIQAKIENNNSARRTYEKNMNGLNHQLAQVEARRNWLLKSQQDYEGYYKSVQRLMLAKKSQPFLKKAMIDVIAGVVETKAEYETALSIALGNSVQNVLIYQEKDAAEIINYLKKHQLGRVTFLPLDTIQARSLSVAESKILNMPGCLGTFDQLTRFNPQYASVIRFLLGRVVLTDTIENAVKCAKKIGYSLRFVTIEGEVINAGGSITGGSIGKNQDVLIGRKREVAELDDEITSLENQKNNIHLSLQQMAEKQLGLERLQSDSSQKIQFFQNEIVQLKTELNYMNNEQEEISHTMKRIIESINLSDDEKLKYFIEKDALLKSIETIQVGIETKEKSITEKNQAYQRSQEYVNQLKQQIMDQKLKNSEQNNQLNILLKEQQHLEEGIKGFDLKNRQVHQEIKTLEEKISHQAYSVDTLKVTLDQLQKTQEIVKNEKLSLVALKTQKQQLSYALQRELNEVHERLNEDQVEIHGLKLKIESIDNKINQLSDQLWEDYGMNYAMSIAYKDESISITRLNQEVREMKKQIRQLGDINVNAIQEYKEVSERYQFLSQQQKDLYEAKDKLEKIIKDLTLKMKKQFEEEYSKIRGHFKQVFTSLFHGGKADILLVDESDALNSDIEIYAQPPGKSLNKISLLSGGEKALTAIALLFAILKTKPTPFCILDEIEAALDDANVHRFAKYLKTFSKETQFLIITHRKGTMEYVDTLYGATMEEQGVTKLVSLKLSEYAS